MQQAGNNQGENMLLWDSNYSEERRRSFMFGSIDNVNVLSRCDHLAMDGTFSSAPQLWQKLLSVHGLFDSGQHLPLVYGMIPGKTQVLYTDFLSELDSFAGFDFKQALWRKLQAFDLDPEYKVLSSPIRRWFKTIGALPFMEPGSVVDVWCNEIVDYLPTEMNEFASYFERTWIGTPTTEPIFDKYLWNMYDSVLAGLPRSNNLVEGWHNGFQTLVGWLFQSNSLDLLDCSQEEGELDLL